VNWNPLLETVFTERVEGISKMHMLTFKKDGVVLVQETSSSPTKKHPLIADVADVCGTQKWRDMMKQEEFALPTKLLEELQQRCEEPPRELTPRELHQTCHQPLIQQVLYLSCSCHCF